MVSWQALRLLVDRRDALSRRRVQCVNRLQALLAELLPGQGKKDITAPQAKALLATVRPRDVAGKTCRRIAAEELAELVAVDAKIKKSSAELKALVLARGSHLMDLHGVGPVVAARVLADVGDVARFADRNRFASWTGTAPLDASSGEHDRHRLSRAGNRRVNHVIHIAAVTQLRLDTDGRAYYRRKRAEGKKPMEAMRCLKRRISDALYRQLARRRPTSTARGRGRGSGRAPRGVSCIQRGRLTPAHRHFGSATSRTRTNDATRADTHAEDHTLQTPRTRLLTTEGSRSDVAALAAEWATQDARWGGAERLPRLRTHAGRVTLVVGKLSAQGRPNRAEPAMRTPT